MTKILNYFLVLFRKFFFQIIVVFFFRFNPIKRSKHISTVYKNILNVFTIFMPHKKFYIYLENFVRFHKKEFIKIFNFIYFFVFATFKKSFMR